MWWDDAVIYQVYVRSFQDSDGDGVGDLPGVVSRLEYIAGLGAGAVWLSPIYPSPNADFGYDVTDFEAVEPAFGTLGDLDRLVERAHELGLRVILDFVPCHTSTRHPWFTGEHREFYVWSDEPTPDNWRAAFGGSAWGRDEQTGRYYLHSFFPEQADLDWHQAAVREAMTHALRFWRDRGVDGFRLDALDRLIKDDQLRDDPPASGPPPLPMDPADAELDHVHSRNAPGIGDALGAIRDAVGDETLLVGEVFLPTEPLAPYTESLDVVFNFETMFAATDAARLKQAIAAALQAGHTGWVMSNHDFSRLATRAGPANARACAMLLLSLPGTVFVYQGDELGMTDATTTGPPQDRNGRDPLRVPMRWDASPHAGFTTGTPWLTAAGAQPPPADEQLNDPGSTLRLVTDLIERRPHLSQPATVEPSAADSIVVARGDHIIVVNLGDDPQPAPATGPLTLVLEARAGDGEELATVPPHGGWVATTSL